MYIKDRIDRFRKFDELLNCCLTLYWPDTKNQRILAYGLMHRMALLVVKMKFVLCNIVCMGNYCTGDKNTGQCGQFKNVSSTLDTVGGGNPMSEKKSFFFPKLLLALPETSRIALKHQKHSPMMDMGHRANWGSIWTLYAMFCEVMHNLRSS